MLFLVGQGAGKNGKFENPVRSCGVRQIVHPADKTDVILRTSFRIDDVSLR
jgi:hypothetical protein